jgi:Na+/proline symporter
VKLKFPPGVVGLLIAALMAATMSSIDSGIHSVTTALVVDFRDRLMPQWKPKTEQGEMLTARILLVVIGSAAVILACFVSQLGDVFAVAKKTTAAFGGPLLAVFVLGMFSSRVTPVSVFVGTLAGAVFTAFMMDRYPDWFSMWFWPLGFFGALILSVVLSVLPVAWNRYNPGNALTFLNLRKSE